MAAGNGQPFPCEAFRYLLATVDALII